MPTTHKTPNNDTVTKMARIIVSKEIGRIIGPTGAYKLVRIGALLQLIHPLYQEYFDAVDKGEIYLEQVKEHFSPDAWAAFTTPKRRLLETAIRKEVEVAKKEIQVHMAYLRQNDTQLATLSPKGQQALALVLQELSGLEPAGCLGHDEGAAAAGHAS